MSEKGAPLLFKSKCFSDGLREVWPLLLINFQLGYFREKFDKLLIVSS